MVDRQALFQEALSRASAKVGAEQQAASDQAASEGNLLTGTLDAVNAAGLGIVQAGIEGANFIGDMVGLPESKYENRAPIMNQLMSDAAELDRRSGVNAFVGDTAQFITGMVGVGKLMPFLKGTAASTKLGSVGREVVRGGIVGATAFDPQQERLSNLIEAYPQLSNPITAYLAADMADSNAEGRFKNALEGMGLDVALSGALGASVFLFKALRGGDPATIAAATNNLEVAEAARLNPTPNVVSDALAAQPVPGAPVTDATAQAAIEGGASRPGTGTTAQVTPPAPLSDADAMAAIEGGSPARPNVDADAMAAIEGGPSPKGPDGGVTTPPQAADPMVAQIADGIEPTTPVGPLTGRGGNVIYDNLITEGGKVTGGWETPKEGQPLRVLVQNSDEGLAPASVSEAAPTTQGTLTAGNAPVKASSQVEVQVPLDVEVATLTKSFDDDMAAITQYGSREGAEAAGYKFAAGIPWNKMTTAGEAGLREYADQVATVFKSQLDEAKGGAVLSDAAVERLVRQRTTLYGEDPSALVGMLSQAGANANAMAANMEAAFLVANKAMLDVFKLNTNIRAGNFAEFGGSAQLAENALRNRLAMAIELLGHSKAMSSGAGRTLRRMRTDFRIDPAKLRELQKLDIEDLGNLLDQTKGNPKDLAKMSDAGFLDRTLRGAGSIMANNLLWGWPTHVTNIATSAFMAAVRPAEKIVGSFLVKDGKGMRQAALKEYFYMATALSDSWEMARTAFVRGDSVLSPHGTEWFTAGTGGAPAKELGAGAQMGFVPTKDFGSLLKNGMTALDLSINMPTRALGMVDELIKQTSYRGYVQAKAAVRAQEMGLEGQDFKEFVQKAMDDAFDANNQALDRDALYEAQVRTFSQPLQARGHGNLPTLGSMLQNNVAQHPALRAIFPFVRTPVNVFRYAVKMTPGLNLIQKEYWDMITGKLGAEMQAQAYGQFFVGSTALAIGAMSAANGHVTGGGPKEPGLRRALDATGWKPYSFVFDNGDGSKTYVPYNRFDPLGLLFGMSADVTEMMVTYPDRENGADDLATAALLSIIKNVSDKTYLQSINGVVSAFNDPERNATKWAGQLGESMIPFSSGLRYLNPDPYMREATSFMDHVLDRMPGFSQNLPPQRDPFGYPVPVRTGVVFQDNADDIVDAEQIRMFQETGTGLAVPMTYNREGVDLRDLMVTVDGRSTTAWDRLQEIGIKPQGFRDTMKEAVSKVIQSETYQMAPDGAPGVRGTKLSFIQEVVGKYREAAFKQLQRQFPEVRNAIGARQKEVRDAWRVKQSGGVPQDTMKDVANLLSGYGVALPQQG